MTARVIKHATWRASDVPAAPADGAGVGDFVGITAGTPENAVRAADGDEFDGKTSGANGSTLLRGRSRGPLPNESSDDDTTTAGVGTFADRRRARKLERALEQITESTFSLHFSGRDVAADAEDTPYWWTHASAVKDELAKL